MIHGLASPGALAGGAFDASTPPELKLELAVAALRHYPSGAYAGYTYRTVMVE